MFIRSIARSVDEGRQTWRLKCAIVCGKTFRVIPAVDVSSSGRHASANLIIRGKYNEKIYNLINSFGGSDRRVGCLRP